MNDSGAENIEARISEESAHWVLRCDRGLTPREQDDFSEWLAADPRHGASLARFRRDWSRLDKLSDWRPSHSMLPNPDLLAPSKRPSRRLLWIGVSLASAAGIALATFLDRPGMQVPSLTAAAAIVMDRVLDDQSVVQLNRGTAVDVAFTPVERRVHLLRGEAHFTVTKDTHRPFVVTANGVDVRAVGTAFNVRVDAGAVEVLVTEGHVQVKSEPTVSSGREGTAKSAVSDLEVRQRAVVTTAAASVPVRIDTLTLGEVERVLSWQHRMMEFNSSPLADVVAEFNRRNSTQLVVMDPELASTRITVSFRTDNVDGFVRLLQSPGFGVRVVQQGERELLLYKAR
jgi:transmembrane sensor